MSHKQTNKMVRQIFAMSKYPGVVVKEEIPSSRDGNRQGTLNGIIEDLRTFYNTQGLDFNPQGYQTRNDRQTHRVINPNTEDSRGRDSRVEYHGNVSVVYTGQNGASDISVMPTYYFVAESFGVYFNVGRRSMPKGKKKELSVRERDAFLTFLSSGLR